MEVTSLSGLLPWIVTRENVHLGEKKSFDYLVRTKMSLSEGKVV